MLFFSPFVSFPITHFFEKCLVSVWMVYPALLIRIVVKGYARKG